MKRILAMLLPMVLALGICVPAYAATTYTLTLNGAQAGHTYAAYQVFAGDVEADSTSDKLSNITWGAGVTEAGKEALGDAAAKAESLDDVADAEAFAKEIAPYLGSAAGSVAIAEGKTSGTISGLQAGYYLVKTTATTTENGVHTYYIMKVVKNTQVNIKANAPSVLKTVNDNDASIGDTVRFTLTGTMPSTVDGYTSYKVIFHDAISAGLAYAGNLTVAVDGIDRTADFKVAVAGGDLTVSCDDVLAAKIGATADSSIVVSYDAVLDSDAIIGVEGNPNTVCLEYSNNPNWGAEDSTGKTPQSEVKVYTWEMPVFKYVTVVDAGSNEEREVPLAGAGFTLYKDSKCEDAVRVLSAGEGIYKVCSLPGCADAHITEIVTGSTGEFEIEGLEQGTYYLKETTVPDGYNACETVTVVIGEGGSLAQNGTSTNKVAVLNKAGAVLPSTGGAGTTALYVGGAILVIGAAALLVIRRRMGSDQ